MKQVTKRKRRLTDILMLSLLLVGLSVLAYPFVSDSLNNYLDQKIIERYQKKANAENHTAMEKTKAKMQAENAELAKKVGNPGTNPFSEETAAAKSATKQEPNFFDKHTLGVLHIPKLTVSMPIFDKTNEIFLQKGSSLLEGTSYPTGGTSTHAVISAHRGLPRAQLFTDLPKLKKGDEFYIEINGEMLAYEVFEKEVIEPTETDSLLIRDNQDIVTLLTCTPYMVNSHRLLVTGKRVPYHPKKAKRGLDKTAFWNKYGIYFWVIGAVAIFGTVMLVVLRLNKRKRAMLAQK